jgi:hypothetical protein
MAWDKRIDINTLEDQEILPNGVEVVGHVNAHIVSNLRAGGASRLNLPSLWREARAIVTERAPFRVVVAKVLTRRR